MKYRGGIRDVVRDLGGEGLVGRLGLLHALELRIGRGMAQTTPPPFLE